MRLVLIYLCLIVTFNTTVSHAISSHHSGEAFIYGVKKRQQQDVNKSFNVTPDDFDIVLVKSLALNQPFLLKTSIIATSPAPTGRSLSSKVVTFEKKGNYVYLFESTEGKLSTRVILCGP